MFKYILWRFNKNNFILRNNNVKYLIIGIFVKVIYFKIGI